MGRKYNARECFDDMEQLRIVDGESCEWVSCEWYELTIND
jgi:hypothetical protein